MNICFYLYNKGKRVCGLYGLFAQFTDVNDAKVYNNSQDMRNTVFKNVQSKLRNMQNKPSPRDDLMGVFHNMQLIDTEGEEWEFDELRIYSSPDDKLVDTFPIADIMNLNIPQPFEGSFKS